MADRRKLLADWEEVLTRREPLRETLGLYGEILTLWAEWIPQGGESFQKDEAWCRARWEGGVPLLLGEEEVPLSREAVEPLLSGALDLLHEIREADGPGLAKLREAWDGGEITPSALLPTHSLFARAVLPRLGLSSDIAAFLCQIVLRPLLEEMAEPLKGLWEGRWDHGTCPFCGASAAFSDFREDGKRRLLCYLCGSDWGFLRIRCAFCDNRDPDTLKIFSPEEEEGYFVEACDLCRGYLKGLDRRLRWNVVSSLLEDWGSPHLDLIALEKGYWRSGPSLVLLAREG